MLPIFLGLVVLLPAGTLLFWPIYAYFGVLVIPVVLIIRYFLKNNPEFLERRVKAKESEKQQKYVVLVSSLALIAGFMVSGFDFRFGWSDVPVWLVLVADLVVFLGYVIISLVFKENSYASRVVEVGKGQRVITTGPYRIVRHPMYSAMVVMFLATPVALASWWAFIPFVLFPVLLVPRILNEEKVLRGKLPGYADYCSEVKYRLIPFIW